MARFGSEPYQRLSYCVRFARLIESQPITRDEISDILIPEVDSQIKNDLNKFSFDLFYSVLGWIEKKSDGKYHWKGIRDPHSKILWDNSLDDCDEKSVLNLQKDSWALLASFKKINPLPQIIATLLEKNVWIIDTDDSADNFFTELKNKETDDLKIPNLFQSSDPKFRASFFNLNDLGLTRPLRKRIKYYVHVEMPPEITFFIIQNFFFNKGNNEPSIYEVLELFKDVFGIIDDTSKIPKVLQSSFWRLHTKKRIRTLASSGEVNSLAIQNPEDRKGTTIYMSHLRAYG